MALENYTGNIADLVVTNPTPTDPKSQGDDHLRGIKYTLKHSFPNFDGPMNAAPEEVERAASSVPPGGLPFCKNKLFNGEVMRINQRGFDGNWATKNTWNASNTIAQQELCYGYDMWAKASATDMVQPIEEGNFRPSTVHTISGLNMTTRQETSPAYGNWNIVVPQAARNVQVEEGAVATPFEIRPISFELAQCQRYYEIGYGASYIDYDPANVPAVLYGNWRMTKRTTPSLLLTNTLGGINQATAYNNIAWFAGVSGAGAPGACKAEVNASAVI